MEIVTFADQAFGEISEQDNPAFGKTECVMICKTTNNDHGDDKRLSILHIIPDPTESVNRIAVVWGIKVADLFAKAFVDHADN